jgi:uncharacterized membrane protein YoaK (UPF0700 family)
VTTRGATGAASARVPGEAGQGAVADLLAVGLAAASGATDAISFLRLGSVFTSVMTGNLVLLGLSVARRDGAQAAHALVAISAFAAGVAAASRIAGRATGERPWSRGVGAALVAELAVLCVVLGLWEGMSHGRPSGAAQLAQLACAALALGMQSGAVRAMGIAGLSTTYLTGTLTALVGTSATGGRLNRRSVVLLAAVAVGAAGGGALAVEVPGAAPLLPVSLVLLVVVGWSAGRARAMSRSGGARAR